MKLLTVSTTCVVAVLVPLVATFKPNFVSHRYVTNLKVASDDIVKAYSKSKLTAELSIPELPVQPGAAAPPPPPPVVPEPVVTATKAAVSKPSFDLDLKLPDKLPEIKYNLDIPSNDAIKSSLTDNMNSMKSSLPSMEETSAIVNEQFKGLNSFFKESQDQWAAAAARAAERTAAAKANAPPKAPTMAEMFQKGIESHRTGYTETNSFPIPQGETPNLMQYLTGGLKTNSPYLSNEALAESKAKLNLLMENAYGMFGSTPPSDLSDIQLPEGVDPQTAGVVGVGVVLLLAAGNNNKSDGVTTVSTSGDVSSIANDVVSITFIVLLCSGHLSLTVTRAILSVL